VEQRLQDLRHRLVPHVVEDRAQNALGAFRGLPAVGTPEQIVENLSALKRRGLAYAIFYFPELAYDRSGLELFEREVIPALAG
jgi:alkanesulfonate monooxygenase SsuD/methylene tetrahydromethanopterin reductase-like flavin-dependent oxidoreductase (luciferase family)